MKPLLLSLCFLGCCFHKTFAQLCGFDFAFIIVVSAHEEGSNKTIKNLRLTLVDSTGAPVVGYRYQNKELILDTLEFWQNPATTRYGFDYNNQSVHFPFAKDHYIYVGGYEIKEQKLWLKIEDPTNKYKVPSMPLKLYEIDAYRLCGVYNDPVYSTATRTYGGRVYQPIEIVLEKKR